MEILLVSAFLQLIEKLLPIIEAKTKTGEISVSEQAKVRADYLALREKGDSAFNSPEWAISTKPVSGE